MLVDMKKVVSSVDPYDRLIWLMEKCGHIKTDSPAGRLKTLVVSAFMVNGWLGPFLYAFLAVGPKPNERVEAALFGSGALTLSNKFFNTLLRQGRTKRIVAILNNLKDQYYDEVGVEMKEEFHRRNASSLRVIFSILCGLVPLMTGMALLASIGAPPEHRKYPFPCWTPLDLREYFITNFIWQTLTLGLIMFNAAISYSFLFLTINQTVSQMEVLCMMLKSREINIKGVIKRHILIIKLVSEINKYFCWQLAMEMGGYAAQIALAGHDALKAMNSHGQVSVVFVSIYVMSLYTAFAYCLCLCGHKISMEGDHILNSIYESKWYELPIEDQKSLRLMLCFAVKGLKMRYKSLVEFSMESFSHLLNSTYSFLTLLSRMEI